MKVPIQSELSREMTLFQVTMMGTGMMIGAGVFVATGIGIGIAGPGGLLLAFALNGLLAFFSVMTYAELGSALPKAGGGYSYVQESSGGIAGFLTGWISWFGHSVAGSLYAITFATYTLHFLSGFEFFRALEINYDIAKRIVAVAMAVLFIYINYRGASNTGKAGVVIAVGQTLVLLIIGAAGVVVCLRSPEKLNNFTPFLAGGWGKVMSVMGFCLIGFEGYEVISNTAEEVIDAKKNIPRGIFYAVILVITTYLLVAFASVVGGGRAGGSLVEWFRQKGATGFAEAVERLFPLGGLMVVLAAVFASTSALNATIYSSTRVSFALGRDGHLPSIFSHVSKKTRIPDAALLFSGSITIIVAALFDVETVTAGASLFFIVLFNIVTFSGMKIRIDRGHELRYGYLMPLFPVVPIVSILGRTVIGLFILDMSVTAYLIAGSWLGLGILYYSLRSRKKASVSGSAPATPRTEDEPEARQILVGLANARNIPVLLKYSSILAESRNDELALSTVVQVPYQTPIDVAEQFTREARDLLDSAAETLSPEHRVRCYIRYAHNTAEGIIQSARSRNADLLVLGWRGYNRRQYVRMGSTLDPVIERAACDLLVIRPGSGEPSRRIRNILCPTKGKGPHGRLTWNIVKRLAAAYNADVTIMHVTPLGSAGTIPEQLKQSVSVEYEGFRYTVKIMQSGDPAARIVEESRDYDLVVIGASDSSIFQRVLFGSKPLKIAGNCSCTVIMVRKNTGLRSWFKRWFL